MATAERTGAGGILTPVQRLRQLDPSWLRSGHTTSLFASVIEKEDVRDDLGGILDGPAVHTPPCDVKGFWRGAASMIAS